MKIAMTILAIVIGLLSIAAGGAKVALVPEEAEFLGQFGFTNALIVAFGLVQVAGGLLLVVPVTRFYGALIAAAGFALSVALILISGNLAFAGVSLVPLLLTGFVAYRSYSVRLLSDRNTSNS